MSDRYETAAGVRQSSSVEHQGREKIDAVIEILKGLNYQSAYNILSASIDEISRKSIVQ